MRSIEEKREIASQMAEEYLTPGQRKALNLKDIGDSVVQRKTRRRRKKKGRRRRGNEPTSSTGAGGGAERLDAGVRKRGGVRHGHNAAAWNLLLH